ncbi:unnamed protein product [Cylicostephanus goldi]|uniref:Uncharacterized protein n=1 Tax=Cylicostephanus goldi TaxID=71465 RepID=A0A3P6R4X2_CYLGO|nr:unnamed protein product [Cylicostephanus goldi]
MFVLAVLLLELVEVVLMMTDVTSGQIVEGFSNEALALLTIVVGSFVACAISYFIKNNRNVRIHPDLVGDVQGFRESFVRGQSGRVNEARVSFCLLLERVMKCSAICAEYLSDVNESYC